LLVPIDLHDGAPTGPSLFALSEGRRVAHVAGVTVFAIVMTERRVDDKVAARLGQAGADKVLACEGPGLGAPPLDLTHGPALYAAIERVPPLLVLFPAGSTGAQLGPGLAARLGGAFAASADLEVGQAATPLADGIGRVFVRRWRSDRTSYRRLDPVELERPVIAILPAGDPPPDQGSDEVEVEVITCAAPAKVGVTELSSEVDDQAAAALASILIVVDPTLGAEALAKLSAAAPPGVTVVDAVAAAPAVAMSVPRIVIGVGGRGPVISGTPRSRVGVVLAGVPPRGQRLAADVLLRLPAGDAAGATIDELAAGLASLAGAAGKAAPS
jgi:electron transfer flavoprotein alpha subunit